MKLNKEETFFQNAILTKERAKATAFKQARGVGNVPILSGEAKVLQDKMEYLDDKLTKKRKEITSYDVYKITEVVNSPREFEEKIAKLLPNNSLIINCENFSFGYRTYSRGDLIVKDNYGKEEYIPSQSGGMYYPSQIREDKKNKGYTISYVYTTEVPSQESKADITINSDPLKHPVNTLNIQGLNDSYKGGIYGQEVYLDGSTTSFVITTKITDAGQAVRPLIKFFTKDYEEVYCNYNISGQGGTTAGEMYNWTVSNFPVSLIMKVVIK